MPRGDHGSCTFFGSSGKSVVAYDKTMRSDSRGGAGAQMLSSLAILISRETRRLREFGLSSSPVLTSTSLTLMGGRPDFFQASWIDRMRQTPLEWK